MGNIKNTNMLMLALYFFLKNNSYDKTAEVMYNEMNFDKVYEFPSMETNNIIKPSIDEAFRQYFFKNVLLKSELERSSNTNSSNDEGNKCQSYLAENWNKFWTLFCRKIENSTSHISPLDEFLEKSEKKLTYNQETLHNTK
jgi:hypothetical protein